MNAGPGEEPRQTGLPAERRQKLIELLHRELREAGSAALADKATRAALRTYVDERLAALDALAELDESS